MAIRPYTAWSPSPPVPKGPKRSQNVPPAPQPPSGGDCCCKYVISQNEATGFGNLGHNGIIDSSPDRWENQPIFPPGALEMKHQALLGFSWKQCGIAPRSRSKVIVPFCHCPGMPKQMPRKWIRIVYVRGHSKFDAVGAATRTLFRQGTLAEFPQNKYSPGQASKQIAPLAPYHTGALKGRRSDHPLTIHRGYPLDRLSRCEDRNRAPRRKNLQIRFLFTFPRPIAGITIDHYA